MEADRRILQLRVDEAEHRNQILSCHLADVQAENKALSERIAHSAELEAELKATKEALRNAEARAATAEKMARDEKAQAERDMEIISRQEGELTRSLNEMNQKVAAVVKIRKDCEEAMKLLCKKMKSLETRCESWVDAGQKYSQKNTFENEEKEVKLPRDRTRDERFHSTVCSGFLANVHFDPDDVPMQKTNSSQQLRSRHSRNLSSPSVHIDVGDFDVQEHDTWIAKSKSTVRDLVSYWEKATKKRLSKK